MRRASILETGYNTGVTTTGSNMEHRNIKKERLNLINFARIIFVDVPCIRVIKRQVNVLASDRLTKPASIKEILKSMRKPINQAGVESHDYF